MENLRRATYRTPSAEIEERIDQRLAAGVGENLRATLPPSSPSSGRD
jgi:hypothetical protein